jgi:diguanylate cyclase
VIGRTSASSSSRTRLFEGLFSGRDEADGKLFRQIGGFLAEHHLAPTPSNYTLAHAVVTASDAAIVGAVTAATFGDIRLSQSSADEIMARAAGQGGAAAASASVAMLVGSIDEARERFERYAGIVDTSRADAQAYGDALASGAATLAPASPAAQAETLAALLALTHSMIDKTRSAEDQLRAASVEMDNLRANLAAARADAETDMLTGLPNRRAFEASFAERARLAPTRSMALAMCDIDRFKAINDRHGHDVGDRVIRLVARELSQGCADALVARHGGEEFVALFEDIDAAAACRLLDATRAAINRRSFKVAGTGKMLEDLSFSGGVVTVAPGEAIRDAVKRADAALYRAKQSGRNRIELDG